MAAKAKKTQTRPLFLSLLSTALLFLLLPAISAIDQPDPSNTSNTDFIRTSCNVTLYHDLCFTSLSGYADSIKKSPANLARIAIEVSLARARRMATYLSKLLRQTNSDPGTTAALQDCSTTFDDAIDQMSSSIREMRRLNLTTGGKSFRFQISNVQTWMSASLTNEDTCTDGFDDLPDGPIKSDVSDRVGNVSKFASIALALVNSFAAKVVNEE